MWRYPLYSNIEQPPHNLNISSIYRVVLIASPSLIDYFHMHQSFCTRTKKHGSLMNHVLILSYYENIPCKIFVIKIIIANIMNKIIIGIAALTLLNPAVICNPNQIKTKFHT